MLKMMEKKDKCCMVSPICGLRKCNKLVNIAEKKLTDIENKLVVIRQEKKVGRGQRQG